MAALDPRYDRIVMPARFYVDKALPTITHFPSMWGPTSAKVKVNLDVLTQKIGYRVIDAEKSKSMGWLGFVTAFGLLSLSSQP